MSEQNTFKETVTILLALVLVLVAIVYPMILPGVALPEHVYTFALMGAQFLFGAVAGAFAVKNYVRAANANAVAVKKLEEEVE